MIFNDKRQCKKLLLVVSNRTQSCGVWKIRFSKEVISGNKFYKTLRLTKTNLTASVYFFMFLTKIVLYNLFPEIYTFENVIFQNILTINSQFKKEVVSSEFILDIPVKL